MDTQTSAEPPIKALVVPVTPLRQNCTFVPGHERLSTFGAERRSNPFESDEALGSI